MSQVGLVFINILNVSSNPDIISQNQVKFGTLIKKMRKPQKYNFLLPQQYVRFQSLSYYF